MSWCSLYRIYQCNHLYLWGLLADLKSLVQKSLMYRFLSKFLIWVNFVKCCFVRAESIASSFPSTLPSKQRHPIHICKYFFNWIDWEWRTYKWDICEFNFSERNAYKFFFPSNILLRIFLRFNFVVIYLYITFSTFHIFHFLSVSGTDFHTEFTCLARGRTSVIMNINLSQWG